VFYILDTKRATNSGLGKNNNVKNIKNIKKVRKLQSLMVSIPLRNADPDIGKVQPLDSELKYSEYAIEKIPRFLWFPNVRTKKFSKGNLVPFKDSRISNKSGNKNYSIGNKHYYSKRENMLTNQKIDSVPYDINQSVQRTFEGKRYKPPQEGLKEPVLMVNADTQFDDPDTDTNDQKYIIPEKSQTRK
jgi:hypothetical protein